MDTLSIRAFDADGNQLEPCCEDSSSGDTGGIGGASPSLPSSPGTSLATSSSAGLLAGGVCSSSFEQDADVKQGSKNARL